MPPVALAVAVAAARARDLETWSPFSRIREVGKDVAAAREAWQRSSKCRGLHAAREGRVVEAIRLLEEARHQIHWLDPEIDSNLAELRTIRRLERRLEIRPNDVPTLLELGKAYFSQERSDDSLRTFQRAVALAPASADAHTHLAMELHLRGAHDEAAACYRRALGINPREFNAVVYYADLLCERPLGATLPEETPVGAYAKALPIVNRAMTAEM